MDSNANSMGLRCPRLPNVGAAGARWCAPVVRMVLAIAIVVNMFPAVEAQQIKATEAQLKAAFLFNFAKYVTFPHPPGDRFYICVLGRDPFGSALDSIVEGEKLAGKPAEVKRIRGAQDATGCQVVFISGSEESHMRAILDALAEVHALTVSDSPGFTDHGGMIQFVTEGDRVRFLVNLTAAQRAGLTLSSELLKVAKAVQRSNTPGAV